MPAVEREITISYGGYAVGGETERPIDGYVQNSVGKDIGSVEFSFFVSADTSEDFAAACLAAEKAFRTPYKDTIVTFGQSVVLAKKQSDSSGLDAEPEIMKGEDEGDTGRSRLYTVRIEFGIPADRASMLGRRESTISVEYSNSRRRMVTFSGVWTAVGSTDARAQYTANATSWMTTALSALGGTYEKITENVEETTNDKTVNFDAVYHEILHAQSGSGTDDAGIVDPTMTIRRVRPGPRDSYDQNVVRLSEVECRFSCGIDQDVTKNLDDKWTSIKSWIVQQIQTYIGGGSVAIQTFDIDFDEHDNRLNANVRGLAVDTGATTIVESELMLRKRMVEPKKFVPAWTGDPFSVYIHPIQAELYGTITWNYRSREYVTDDTARGRVVSEGRKTMSGEEWVLIESDATSSRVRLGIAPYQFEVTDVQSTAMFRYVKDEGRTGTITPGASPIGESTAPAGPAASTDRNVAPNPVPFGDRVDTGDAADYDMEAYRRLVKKAAMGQ